MIELAGAILIVLGAILGGAMALTLVWLVIAEWLFWRKSILNKRYADYGDAE